MLINVIVATSGYDLLASADTDPDNAWLSPCALPYFAIAPASVILIIALHHLFGPLLHRWRPKWTLPFVSEDEQQEELPQEGPKHRPLHWTITLFGFTAVGFFAEAWNCLYSRVNVFEIIYVVSWATAAALIAAKRPRSCSIPLLAYFILTLAVDVSMATQTNLSSRSKAVAHYVAASAALLNGFIILLMPFRTSSAPIFEISAVGQIPNSDFRSPEDNLRLWQFLTVSWMQPLISLGRSRQLHERDVWLLGFEFQHRRLHEKFRRLKGSVLARTLRANGLDVLIISTIAIVQMFCDFSTPVLLQQLLKSMQDPSKTKRVPLTYAFLSLVLRLVAAQSQVLNLWYGRRCYERSRGEMVMMVYQKALSRKNILGTHEKAGEVLNEENDTANGDATHSPEPSPGKPGLWRRLTSRKSKLKPDDAKEAASLGKIFNLLRGDVYDVAQRYWEIDSLIDKPLGLIIAVVLVWTLFGPSCFLGILSVLAAQAANAVVTKILLRYERVKRAATDVRLQITSQFVEAIRHLRWYGWQDHWLRQVMDARQHELNLRIITGLWNILISFINTFASGVFPVLALYSYTVLAGHELRIDIIFPALQLFSMLEARLREIPSLITTLINASIALGRIEDFMAEPDKIHDPADTAAEHIPFHLDSCTYAWPGKLTPVLKEVSLIIPKGLTVISGKVGAGKTAFLQSFLGELDQLGGSSRIPNEMVGYCAQTPWLQSMSIRDNILFSSPYQEQRYKKTLEACALLPDLSQFKHGDLTFIGENGIGLSGGQKARVALARAVYSASNVLLLDDPLSALDHNTAEFVTRKLLDGQLVQDRTVVLVTHRMGLVRGIAAQIVNIVDGHVTVYNKSAIEASTNKTGTETSLVDLSGSETEQDSSSEEEASAIPDKFIEEEHRAEWGVKARVYWTYIRAAKYRWWLALVLVLTVYRLAAVGQSWFLKEWGEAYNQIPLTLNEFFAWGKPPPSGDAFLASASYGDSHFMSWNPMDGLPSPGDNVRPWLWAFFCIVSFQAATLLFSQGLMLVIVYCAGKSLFRQVMTRVSHATFRFFDVTPVGRLMNRLTSDIGVVDGNISSQFQTIAFYAITWVSSILVIATATPTFLAFSLLLTVVFVLIFLRFLPTSQSLRRLEMVSLTPLLSNFGELLHGLTTVRAFRAEERFQDRVISVVDKFQGMDHFYWSLQAWLMYRFESLSALSTFGLTVLALYTDTTPGLVAFVLIAANSFVQSTHGLCKQYGQLQMDFVSVERVDELLHVEEESPGTIEPPAAWPNYGSDVVFENATMRYAPHLDPSLKDITLRIPGGSTTAIIGRTGSGKSTLAVSLLSVIRPESGRILIDNINIADVSTQALRTRVTFVAQDPVLFPGSIRVNLDPTNDFSDRQCAEVLERLCGRHGWNLETHIEAGGKNLSQGQRQLIALTRAVLRRSAVVILDEATASIDHETSLEIQQIVREELELSTVITIAHRVEAVKDADYFIELEQGRVLREGRVGEL
ncbi:hypothetical protein N7533_009045 [Penicillium manginii]|uniref:uncharacterized protein n=1 Tax=Penicillium manginii TaxID=203109 RepID=UPI002549A820|nr:uncharacterized protein N7533_009045 [Penicillium manginii]KAJ5744175.1 hypothetical protein N7533_009045 [Penicillium manginii]